MFCEQWYSHLYLFRIRDKRTQAIVGSYRAPNRGNITKYNTIFFGSYGADT